MSHQIEKQKLHRQILAEWLAAVDTGDFERAIGLDFYHYNHLVKATEDSGYWNQWQQDTHPVRVELAARVCRVSPAWSVDARNDKGRFAVVNHNFSGLAHEVQLSRNIQYLRRQGCRLDFDVIYLFDGDANQRARAAHLYEIPEASVHFLSADSYMTAAGRLDIACRQGAYRTVIYPSIFPMAFWMSLFNTHPRQTFLQMKYFPWQAGRIAEWAGGRRNTEDRYEIHGFSFLQLQTMDFSTGALPVGAPGDAPSHTFGSISRPEKVADPVYNRFVASILAERPDLTYLYAGRAEGIKVIPESVRSLPNARHIGWVDPATAIGRFGVYLESFPWGGGEMSFLALRAGVPYLILGSEENIRFGLFDFIRLIAESGPSVLQYSFCRDESELRARLITLIDDPEARRALGTAWREHLASYKPADADRWAQFLLA